MFLLNTDHIELTSEASGFWAWCKELGRYIWIDCENAKVGRIEQDADL